MRYCWLWMIVAVALLAHESLAAKKSKPAATTDRWLVSYDVALRQAKASNRPILACFLGSDWCPYCVRLLKESIWTNDFRTWAADKAVVLILDFPKKTPQNLAIKAKNEALQKKYDVKGFPAVLLIAPDGSEIGRLRGYSGKEAWEKDLVDLVAKPKAKKQK